MHIHIGSKHARTHTRVSSKHAHTSAGIGRHKKNMHKNTAHLSEESKSSKIFWTSSLMENM